MVTRKEYTIIKWLSRIFIVLLNSVYFLAPSFIASGGIYVLIANLTGLGFYPIFFVIIFSLLSLCSVYLFKDIKIPAKHTLFLLILIATQLLLLKSIIASNNAPSHNHDASNHYYFFHSIIESKSLLLSEVFFESDSGFYDGNVISWYPLGYHTGVASVCEILMRSGCVKTAWVLFYMLASSWILTIYLFAFTISNSNRIAMYSSVISLSYFLFPYTTLAWGQWGILAGQTLIPLILILRISLDKNFNILSVLAYLLFLSSLFFVHTTTFITMMILIFIYEFYEIIVKKKIFLNLLPVYMLLIILLLPSLFDYVDNRKIAVSLFGYRTSESPIVGVFSINSALDYLMSHNFNINLNFLIIPFFIIGLLKGIFSKQRLFKFTSFLYILFIVLTLLLIYSKQVIGFFSPIYPWGAPERILSSISFVFILLCGYGIYHVSTLFKIKTQTILFFFNILLSSIYIFTTNVRIISGFNSEYNSVTNSDIQLFDYIQKNISKQKIIFQNPRDDAGAWLPIFTSNKVFQPLYIADNYGENYVKTNLFLDKSLSSEEKYNYLNNFNISYIFKGSKLLSSGVDFIPYDSLNEPYIEELICFDKSCLYEVAEYDNRD